MKNEYKQAAIDMIKIPPSNKIIKMAFFLKKFRKNATSTRWLLLIVRMIFKFEVHSSSILYFFNYPLMEVNN